MFISLVQNYKNLQDAALGIEAFVGALPHVREATAESPTRRAARVT